MPTLTQLMHSPNTGSFSLILCFIQFAVFDQLKQINEQIIESDSVKTTKNASSQG